MRNLPIEENRAIQLEILDTIAFFCNRNNIKYFLIAGSLLGAVRHKGYIPWDDDIDIVMLRKDYDLFVKSFEADNYYLESPEVDVEYFLPFAKVCKKNTYVDEPSRLTKKKLGVNVDIFPIDSVTENIKEQKKQVANIQRHRKILDLMDTPIDSNRRLYKNIILLLSHIVLLPVSPRRIVGQIIELSTKYNGSTTPLCAELVWGCGSREIVNKLVFNDSINLPFENKEYSCPIGWDEWLKSRYGDYMKLPPESKQITHHDYKAFIEQE